MPRLNDRAWKILCAEIEKCAAENDLAGQVQRDIALKRLEKLRAQSGFPASLQELDDSLSDLFPNFSQSVLKKAARANRPKSIIGKLLIAIPVTLGGFAGLVWLVNLPYPMVRRPVARVAPMLLLPSYINMDRHYREAIAHVEQADQLVNSATSRADIELGAHKVKDAQANLDQLPVWFLGYQPQRYCTFFSCVWQFTFDEYRAARASVGRMEAKVFQEINALDQLEASQAKLQASKEQYKVSGNPSEQREAIATWQASMDELSQLPSATLAGRMAQIKLTAYQRDFREIVGLVAGSDRSNTLIHAAKQFAWGAAQTCQNPPHPGIRWEQCESLWEQALDRLEDIPLEDADGYLAAQELLATYKISLGNIEVRRQMEEESVEALERSQYLIQRWQANADTTQRNDLISQLDAIINELKKVEAGTTAFEEAQRLLAFAQKKRSELQ
ncbi:MAG: hypothetical protein ACOC3E_00575 [Cyanobacteriota bacterium]